jgi:dTDP-4-amino-4,6-dideoxygalactose transaminase
MPALEKVLPYLEAIWQSGRLTNCGPMHERLEAELARYLEVPHVALFCNGTIALLTALQALRATGEVITTPFSFVATTHALQWNGVKPVFVDLAADGFNLDPAAIEAAITPQTTAILPTHCFGRPCDVEAIREIADRYNLRVLYDAAHAFGVRDSGGSVLRHGDLSVLSFHATKVFHTFEGGAIVCPDAKTKTRIDRLKNFGFVDEVTVVAPGINGKMSEFNAAFGLVLLDEIDQHLARRGEIERRYRERLSAIDGIRCPEWSPDTRANFCYFPILVGEAFALTRDELFARLRDKEVYARRYFYPLISDFPTYRGLPSARRENLPNATRIAEQVMCLPIGADVTADDVDRVVDAIVEARGK